MGAHPELVRGLGRREQNERAARGPRILAADVRRITEACGEALATGRAVPMQLNIPPVLRHRGIARNLRAVLEYERRNPQRGVRGLLRRALREQEKRGYASARYPQLDVY